MLASRVAIVSALAGLLGLAIVVAGKKKATPAAAPAAAPESRSNAEVMRGMASRMGRRETSPKTSAVGEESLSIPRHSAGHAHERMIEAMRERVEVGRSRPRTVRQPENSAYRTFVQRHRDRRSSPGS